MVQIRHAGRQAYYYSPTGTLKQRDLNQSSLTCLCFMSQWGMTMSLPSSITDFVPCDLLLQKAYYMIPELENEICSHVLDFQGKWGTSQDLLAIFFSRWVALHHGCFNETTPMSTPPVKKYKWIYAGPILTLFNWDIANNRGKVNKKALFRETFLLNDASLLGSFFGNAQFAPTTNYALGEKVKNTVKWKQ